MSTPSKRQRSVADKAALEEKRLAAAIAYVQAEKDKIAAIAKYGMFKPNGEPVPPPRWPYEGTHVDRSKPWIEHLYDLAVSQATLPRQERFVSWAEGTGVLVLSKARFTEWLCVYHIREMFAKTDKLEGRRCPPSPATLGTPSAAISRKWASRCVVSVADLWFAVRRLTQTQFTRGKKGDRFEVKMDHPNLSNDLASVRKIHRPVQRSDAPDRRTAKTVDTARKVLALLLGAINAEKDKHPSKRAILWAETPRTVRVHKEAFHKHFL